MVILFSSTVRSKIYRKRYANVMFIFFFLVSFVLVSFFICIRFFFLSGFLAHSYKEIILEKRKQSKLNWMSGTDGWWTGSTYTKMKTRNYTHKYVYIYINIWWRKRKWDRKKPLNDFFSSFGIKQTQYNFPKTKNSN